MPETIGQQLKRTRLEKNLSIEQVVQATRIRANAITALEADDFESLSSPTQARGFLKIYVNFLGLSLEEMFARQRQEPGDTGDAAPPSVVEPAGPIPAAAPPAPLDEPLSKPLAEPPGTAARQPGKPRSRKKVPTAVAEEGTLPAPASEVPAPPDQVTPASPREAAPPEDGETPLAQPAAPPASQEIFIAVGRQLLQRRESLGLSLEEIERHTSVRKRSLELLENGQFDQLPSSVQARGMLNNYARFLDLDVDALLLEFANGLQAQLAERRLASATPVRPEKRSALKFALPAPLQRILTPDLLVGGGLLVFLVAFAIWGAGRVIRLNASSTPVPTPQSISDILLSTPLPGEGLPTGTSAPGTASPTIEGLATLAVTLPPAGDKPVQVVVVASRSAWVKVINDDTVEFEGRVVAGTAYAYDADTQIEVVTGDGAALSIIYNQSNLGPMGAYGEFVDRIYTATTILVPTATFTPSPSITPTPTITPRPSATPRPSRTLPSTPTLNP